MPAQHRQRRLGQEALGASRRGADAGKVRGVLEAHVARLPGRAGTSRWIDRGTRAASCGSRAAGLAARAATPGRRRSAHRARTPRGTSRSSTRPDPTPKVAERSASAATISSIRPLSAVGSRRIRSSDNPLRPHGTKLRNPRSVAFGVERLDQHALAVERILEPTEGHREAALVAAVASPLARGIAERGEVLGGQGLVPDDVGGVAPTLEPRDRLTNRLHAGAGERELPHVDDRLVADLERGQTPPWRTPVRPPRRHPSRPATTRWPGPGRASARSLHPSAAGLRRGCRWPGSPSRSPGRTPRLAPLPHRRYPTRSTCRAGSRSTRASRCRRTPVAGCVPAPRRRAVWVRVSFEGRNSSMRGVQHDGCAGDTDEARTHSGAVTPASSPIRPTSPSIWCRTNSDAARRSPQPCRAG